MKLLIVLIGKMLEFEGIRCFRVTCRCFRMTCRPDSLLDRNVLRLGMPVRTCVFPEDGMCLPIK